jgi:hypothetical protein
MIALLRQHVLAAGLQRRADCRTQEGRPVAPKTRTAKTRNAAKKKSLATRRASFAASKVSEGVAVLLPRRTDPAKPVRLTTLSWSLKAGGMWGQSSEQFLASVAQASHRCGSCDLMVTAGLTVDAPPSVGAILKASSGLPVVFEAKKDGLHSWFLAHSSDGEGRFALLRRQQVVTSFDQYDRFPRLAEIVASGAGTIAFVDTDLRLVLFICGENNLLDSTRTASVLKAASDQESDRERLAGVLSGPWVVLNPAHEPYYPQI